MTLRETQTVLEAQALGFAYDADATRPEAEDGDGDGDQPWALKDLSLTLERGEWLALLGPNGSGKTTLLRLLSGVLRPRCGRVLLEGRPLEALSPRAIAQRMAFLSSELEVGFAFGARQVVELGRTPYLRPLRALRDCDRQAVDRALAATQASAFADRPLQGLSSGERQRVFIAMALAQEPRVLLLDEPVAHLDWRYQLETLELLRRLVDRQGLAVMAALHDLNLAAAYADRVALLHRGRLHALGAPGEVLTPATVEGVFGVRVQALGAPGDGFYLRPLAVSASNRRGDHEP